MAAVNKVIQYSHVWGQVMALLKGYTVQPGATQLIKKGEICKIRSLTDFSTYPIIPAVADDSGFIPVIANQEQRAGDEEREIQFMRPTRDCRFYFNLNTATLIKNGDQLEIHDSQTLKKGSSNVVAVVDDPNIPVAGSTVSQVRVAFVAVTAANLNQDPYIGTPAEVTVLNNIGHVIADPGTGEAIPVNESGQIALTIAESANETNTVAAPAQAGLELLISAIAVGTSGSRAITFAAELDGTNDKVTFDAEGETLRVMSVQTGALTYAWRLVCNVGATLGTST